MKSLLRTMGVVFALWNIAALIACGGDYASRQLIGHPVAFWELMKRLQIEGVIWTVLTPLVLAVSKRVPLRRSRLAPWLSIHLGVFAAICLFSVALEEWLMPPLLGMPAGYQGSRYLLRLATMLDFNVWMYWPLVCVQALLDSRAKLTEQRTRAAQLEAALVSSQLAMLRAQIQPHFLFNTLYAISSLVRSNARAAEEMLADLAQILRAAFADPQAQEIRLESELELVRCYLRIQKCRYGDRLAIHYRIGDDVLRAQVPALLLQSLVENAVTHGVAPVSRAVSVAIIAQVRNDQLHLSVADSGAGLPEPLLEGVGLSNTRARLQRLYGGEQSMHISGARGQGATVAIDIPYRVDPDEPSELPWTAHAPSHADRRRRAPGPPEPELAAGL